LLLELYDQSMEYVISIWTNCLLIIKPKSQYSVFRKVCDAEKSEISQKKIALNTLMARDKKLF
jgi:hypothetical protein